MNKPVMMDGGAYFQRLMGFMGFTEGLCAMYEEPEAVYDLFTYLSDFHLEKEKIFRHYYNPDIWYLLDDNATKLNPFISPEMNWRLVIPFQKKQADLARDAGCRVLMHDCGRCEDFIDDWLEIGVSAWDQAQIQNDLLDIKEQYGMRMGIIGGWDYQGPPIWPDTPDEVMMEAAVQYVDTLAPAEPLPGRRGSSAAWTNRSASVRTPSCSRFMRTTPSPGTRTTVVEPESSTFERRPVHAPLFRHHVCHRGAAVRFRRTHLSRQHKAHP